MDINSICFSLPSLIFIITILSIFLLKKKTKDLSDYYFIALMVLICIIGVLETILPFAIMNYSKITTITEVITRIFFCLNACWLFLFVVYIDVVVYKGDKLKKDKWLRIPGHFVSFALAIFFIISYLTVDINFTSTIYNSFFAPTGKISYLLYANIFLANMCILSFINMNRERIKNIYLTPIVLVLIFYIIAIFVQLALNIEMNEITFFGSLLITIIYFTIESQDFKLADEYKKSKEEAEEEDKAKTSFLVNMSHEIRTPLNTIVGFAQLINEEKTFDEENFRKDLKNITDASESLSSLINNILDISKIESEGTSLEEKDYILENLVFEINSLIPSKITNDELRFTIDINQDIPREYNGDAYKIYKMLTYILLNAIDNTTYGEVRLEINGQKLNDNIFEQQYIIYNTGHSMTNESFEKDFNDFVVLQSKGDGNLSSVKLGLIIAKELISILGGEIEFINKKGQGTRYIIKIKQKIVSAVPIGNIFENVTNGLATTRNLLNLSDKTALVVDDGEVNLTMARKSLEQYCIKVLTVKSGKECIEMVKNEKIDVIFLDHMMPEMDGIATIKALNSTGYKIPPIVALTANNYDALKNEYIAAGFYEYLQKPIVFKELNRVMKKIFAPEEE